MTARLTTRKANPLNKKQEPTIRHHTTTEHLQWHGQGENRITPYGDRRREITARLQQPRMNKTNKSYKTFCFWLPKPHTLLGMREIGTE